MTISPSAAHRVRRLTDVSRALTNAASLSTVLDLGADCALELVSAEKVVVMLADDDGLLRIRAARGVQADTIERFREPFAETLIARLEGVFGPDASDRFLAVPLISRRRVIGLLAVLRAERQAVSEEEEWLLSALGDQVATAVAAARQQDVRDGLEEQVREMDAARSRTRMALRIAGHDLRTPLNAMQGYTDMLAAGVFGEISDRQKEVLERVQDIGRHFVSLLENVLEMAGLVTGGQKLELRENELATIAREAVGMIAPAAERKQIRLVCDLDDTRVRVDADRLRQVILHLLDNAIKYSPADTTVRVCCGSLAVDGKEWGAVTVADEGPGIPVERAEDVFSPFHRITPASDDPGGSGLGLSIARNILDLLDGTVELVYEGAPGATFRIRVPLAAASAATSAP
jgi:signal transduction histidine kinase